MKFLSVKTLFTSCAIALLAFGAATAQEGEGSNPLDPTVPKSQVLVGPVAGVTRNFHTGGFRVIDEPNCPIFEQGGGWGFLGGISAEFQLGKSWSIIPRIYYEARPGKFQQTLPDVLVLIPGSTTPVSQTVSTTSDITYNLVTASVMYKQEFAQIGKGLRFAAAVGPTASYVLSGKIHQVQDLEKPENARFVNPTGKETANNGREIIFANGPIPGANSTRFSLMGGIQAEFGLFNNAWIMTPGAYYDYGLTDVTKNENWNLSSIIFMVDFRRAF
jgi:hypothetical protein